MLNVIHIILECFRYSHNSESCKNKLVVRARRYAFIGFLPWPIWFMILIVTRFLSPNIFTNPSLTVVVGNQESNVISHTYIYYMLE
jgi:hypothetical protein